MTCREAAEKYAAIGWRIFPVHVPIFAPGTPVVRCSCGNPKCWLENDGSNVGKHPFAAHGYRHGHKDARADAGFWRRVPGANIGWGRDGCCERHHGSR